MKFRSAAFNINFYLSVFMALVIFAMGAALLLTNAFIDTIPSPRRTWMGWIFLVYSIFRGVRVWMMIKNIKKSEGQE